MLFNSYTFILVFLPIVLLGYIAIGRCQNKELALIWLVLASLFFYGWWNPLYLALMLFSMVFNYAFGLYLSRTDVKDRNKSRMLSLGVVVNIGFLGYFKYTNFLVDNINEMLQTDIVVDPIILPLAISFFTFQQVAYLVDARRGETREHSPMHYALFVTFFPQLIAGPIVHHKEMLPQFERKDVFQLKAENVSIGLTIFFIGLFKKVVLADNVALYSTPIFEAAESGSAVNFFEAWGGALAYTCQLYFDFSGYADMAIGSARLFGITLPVNFNSPYQAKSIIDFWRRWHMTLSRFLRDYVYFTLGGNRKGNMRRYGNLMMTMLLGGIWHGAGWTFLLWGALHGLYLLINHAWNQLMKPVLGFRQSAPVQCISWLLTLMCIVVAWVYFRAKTISAAHLMLSAMMGLNGFSLPERMEGFAGRYAAFLMEMGFDFNAQMVLTIGEWMQGVLLIGFLLILALFCPNSQQIMASFNPVLSNPAEPSRLLKWSPNVSWAFIISIIAFFALLKTNDVSEFLYFQF